mgnify:CR=1 FL=1
MTRNEWLAQLAHGDMVLLRTKTREFPAAVNSASGDQVWILYALGDGLESATLVDRATGENAKTGYAIFPCQEPATADVREGTNEALQGAQRDGPLPCYSTEDSAPQIASFLARDGMAGGCEAA